MINTVDMNKVNLKKNKSQEGITLFVTLILMGVLLGVSASLLNITLKQYQLSGVSYASEVAFQAANAGMECALYHDWVHDEFDVPGNGTQQSVEASVDCMDLINVSSGVLAESGEEQPFEFTWNGVCTKVSVYKYYDDGAGISDTNVVVEGESVKTCPEDSECTVIQARGYNVACGDIGSGRVVEREYTQVY